MQVYSQSADEVLKALGSDAKTGLSGAEAAKRLAEHGPNRLRGKKKKSWAARRLTLHISAPSSARKPK